MATRRRATYLIQDPYDTDAIEFIRTIALHYGLRPVCFYTDVKGRFYGEREHPVLRSDLIEASYDVDVDDLASFVAEVEQRFDVIGVVPFREDTVEIAADLCELLGLSWNDPVVLRRFRDKYAMKSYLAETAPHVRVPTSLKVTSVDDLRVDALPKRYVIKPNDGFGNMAIGIFDRDETDRAIAHVAAHPGIEWIVEEYIGGVEYHINGQVRRDGSVEMAAIFEYVRRVVNGYPTVYNAETTVHTDEEPFAALTAYAVAIVTALGLRGCPFHLEAKVDESGPCVIDLGARLPSEGTAIPMSRLHPERPDMYLVAAHDYLGLDHLRDLPLDWAHYDTKRAMFVYGISEEETRIRTLEGIDEVEALPEFVRWPAKPAVGAKVPLTHDLLSAPWVVELECELTRDESFEFADRVRSMIVWNRADSPAAGGDRSRRAAPRVAARSMADRASRSTDARADAGHRLSRQRNDLGSLGGVPDADIVRRRQGGLDHGPPTCV